MECDRFCCKIEPVFSKKSCKKRASRFLLRKKPLQMLGFLRIGGAGEGSVNEFGFYYGLHKGDSRRGARNQLAP